jgi:LacI family transcriptional regulator, gluconate utilization system Gnt-I transcriptional repressor
LVLRNNRIKSLVIYLIRAAPKYNGSGSHVSQTVAPTRGKPGNPWWISERKLQRAVCYKCWSDPTTLLLAMPKKIEKRKKSTAPAKRPVGKKLSGITIDDIAAAARVSTATVSRFFNSPQMLKDKTAQRVRDAVTNSGYVPNLAASELASSRSRIVAAVIPVVAQSIFNSTIQALSDSLSQEGYSVLLGLSGITDEHLLLQLKSIIGRRPDGIILTGPMVDGVARKLLKSSGIPTIETWDLPTDPIDLVVGVSHEAIGLAIAQHALSKGRRRALVISAMGVRALARRYSFARAMLEGGAPEPIAVTFAGSTTFGQGRSAVAQHFENGGNADIVVCSSDFCAQGAIHELQRSGRRVPDDVAVIGFGDLDFAADLTPALTTVKIDGAVIGKQAVSFLLQRAQGKKIERPIVDIGFTLVVRASA